MRINDRLRYLLHKKSDFWLSALFVCAVLVGIAMKYTLSIMFVTALALYVLGTVISNGLELYYFIKNLFTEKSVKTAYLKQFSPYKLIYFIFSSGIVVIACLTVFKGMPNVYLLVTSFYTIFVVIINDFLRK